ncbi:MAG: hybrid sensor histidine kinase/response regulator [Magnetococcales bacterium]|nr:hybrid sensor histidine kinase/response regulator [Magnetococcales bacterium]
MRQIPEDLPRILVVDDDTTNLRIMIKLLSSEYRVIVAKNGPEALKRARSNPPPDLILLDIMMPGMDGFAVCRQLKKEKNSAAIPIIIITGMDQPDDETRGLEMGAVDFIRKPFHADAVIARIRIHLELLKQRERLVELNRLKDKFLGMAAHDLRNPLNAICGLSDMLLNLKLTEDERHRFITTILNVGDQMLTLVDDLLDVSVIESGAFEIHRHPGSLEELLPSRIELFRFAAEKKSIHFNVYLSEPCMVQLDEGRMSQVADNLISNAIKFSHAGTQVTIRTGHDETKTWFQVEDQGPGLSDVDQARLFGTFQKLSARPTGQEKSTGLGLAIVKKIVDAHHGEITVKSVVGEGSVFTVSIPIHSMP